MRIDGNHHHRGAHAVVLRFAWLMAIGVGLAASAEADDRPNIALIIADDQTWSDAGCYGSPNVETPNIDRLEGRKK